MADVRVGSGYDAHRFGGEGPIVLGGVEIEHPTGIVATSDGDVVAHAVVDALLGAAALGDIGTHFPSTDPSSRDRDSMQMLEACVRLLVDSGWSVINVDVTVVVESVRIGPHRQRMQKNIAASIGFDPDRVSVKATTTDGLGWIGANEGLAVHAVATITTVP
ncbi:MAG: 2-C-methyl-D-erythritol 2,4-cyclodiphosphate synthase [Acidimicrobiia bacterium]|nr:2-C-methyl-D-erythritol 2,4-cyclodiphosphate synthase [Acidimicrobiia bacterium]